MRGVPVNKRLPYWKAVSRVDAEHVILATEDPHLDRRDAHPLRIDGNNALKNGTRPVGRYIRIRSAKDQDRAAEVEGTVIVEGKDWTVIPLENLIAARRDRPGTLFALASTLDDVRLFRTTLEHGVDGIVLAPGNPGDIEAAAEYLESVGPRAIPASQRAPSDTKSAGDQDDEAKPPAEAADFLVAAVVTAIEDAGAGDRVCVDTTSMFRDGEGLLVGSTARSFCLVHAETIESEYVRARPFRVNAGAVHSYLYSPGGKTRYLSELSAGTNVLAIHPDGVHRVLTVGRAKIERRPHLLVRWETADGQTGNAVLQNAETIRLVRPGGKVVSVTALKKNDKILVHNESAARHFGMPVDEHLEEV